MLKIFCIVSFISIAAIGRAQTGIGRLSRHLFVEWQHWNHQIILGSFAENDKQRIPFTSKNIDNLTEADVQQWLGRSSSSSVLLFHAMWGQQPSFQQNFIQSIDKAAASASPDNPPDIISFIWHAGNVLYRNNWKQAFGKGQSASAALGLIAKQYSENVDVLCHSMGNRFFEGATSNLNKTTHFRSITFFSADLSNATNDSTFQYCLAMTDHAYVYIHQKDRLLLASSVLHGDERLGRSGPSATPPNLSVIDMTAHAKGFSNHSHFCNPWIQSRLSEQWVNRAARKTAFIN